MNWKDAENHSEMIYEENRLATFKKWVFDDDKPCSATKLAEAGFYFVGNDDEPDVVQCFLCYKTLDGWEAEDDPWMEHLKHSASCTFAKLYMPENELTLAQLIEIKIDQIKMFTKVQLEEINRSCSDICEYFQESLLSLNY